jgi:TPR repeat protein
VVLPHAAGLYVSDVATSALNVCLEMEMLHNVRKTAINPNRGRRKKVNELDCEKCLAELNEQGDVSRAIQLCEASPCSANAFCQRYLGWVYATRGEIEQAVEWYLKAAAQGDVDAIKECWNCVFIIEEKWGKEKAVALCERAPLCDHLDFQRYIANFYFDQGDKGRTLLWNSKIAERGGAGDLLYVGRLYLAKDQPLLALDVLKQAAIAGNARARQLLGEMYAFGLGVSKDIETAKHYYEQGAASGLLCSQVRLLHIKRKQGVIASLVFFVRLQVLALKILAVKLRDPHDPRVADILELNSR